MIFDDDEDDDDDDDDDDACGFKMTHIDNAPAATVSSGCCRSGSRVSAEHPALPTRRCDNGQLGIAKHGLTLPKNGMGLMERWLVIGNDRLNSSTPVQRNSIHGCHSHWPF